MAASALVGFIAVFIAVLCFGSNFLPVKKFDTGDGMFYQWCMCSAIFVWGMLLQLGLYMFRDAAAASVEFFPLAAFGGVLWATGNTLSVPVINRIGIGLALLIWGATNMLTGWATGRYGLFGVGVDELASPALNYAGVALVLVALVCFTQVQPSLAEKEGAVAEKDELLAPAAVPAAADRRRAQGVCMAMLAGVFYGTNLTPPHYLIHTRQGPAEPLAYVLSHFAGIFFGSTLWFAASCVSARAAPKVYPLVITPAMVSGLMWAAAQTCWLVANEALSLSVAFPLIASGPGIVSALWGVLLFKEVSGQRNLAVLCVSIAITVLGCTLVALSR
jgi:glucose uptake protein GlcU